MSDVNETVGDRLKQVRGQMSQVDFAASLEIGRTSLINYEKNQRQLDANLLTRLWVLYGVDTLWLLTGIGTRTAEKLTADERKLLEQYRACSGEAQATLRMTAEALAARVPVGASPKIHVGENHGQVAEKITNKGGVSFGGKSKEKT
ncbi:MAG: helix-turn-helix transcriptional regulator [Pseudomonadota bacterium]